jgi:hypothetical protein
MKKGTTNNDNNTQNSDPYEKKNKELCEKLLKTNINDKNAIESIMKEMFTGDNGETLSYAEMRSRYG